MIFSIDIKKAEFREAFKIDTLITFLTCFYPIVCIKRRNIRFGNSEKLGRFLFPESQQNFFPIFSEYQPSFEIHDFIVVDFLSCFYDVK